MYIFKFISSIKFYSYLFFLYFCLINTLYSETIEKIVLSINDKNYSLTQFKNYETHLKLFVKMNNIPTSNLTKSNIFDQFIDKEILKEVFLEYNFQIDENEFNFAFQGYKNKLIKEASNNKIEINSIKDLNIFLKNKNYPNLAFLTEQFKQSMMSSKLIQHFIQSGLIQNPKEENLEKLYQSNQDNLYKEATIKLGHIVLYVYPEDEKNYVLLKKKEELAEIILKELNNNPNLFSKMAKKYSQDFKTKYKDGIIGWLSEQDLVNISYEYIQAFDYDIGKISPLIWTKKGIHILKVFDKKEGRKFTFLEAKNFLKQKVLIEASQQKLIDIIQNRKDFLYHIKRYSYE